MTLDGRLPGGDPVSHWLREEFGSPPCRLLLRKSGTLHISHSSYRHTAVDPHYQPFSDGYRRDVLVDVYATKEKWTGR